MQPFSCGLRLWVKDSRQKYMKKTVFFKLVAATVVLFASAVSVSAEPEKSVEATDSVAVPVEISQIQNEYQLEAYKLKLQHEYELQKVNNEKELKLEEMENEDNQRQRIDNRERRRLSELEDLFMAIIFVFLFPAVLVIAYFNYAKRKQQRQDQLFDLARSGVHVQPELLDLIQPRSSFGFAGAMNVKGVNSNDLTYCMNRILWAVFSGLAGLGLACATYQGLFFYVGITVSAVLLLQAIFRYILATRINQKEKDSENAQ